jgi:hypothetical protein
MDERRSSDKELIAKFGAAIAKLHEDRVDAIKRTLAKIASPQSDHDHAYADYYGAMDRNELIVALGQRSIEGLLHDLFFLFDENEEFKLILRNADGNEIDLAQTVDVIQAFPLDWIEEKSNAGYETGRLTKSLSEKLNLGETRQARRARILDEKNRNQLK